MSSKPDLAAVLQSAPNRLLGAGKVRGSAELWRPARSGSRSCSAAAQRSRGACEYPAADAALDTCEMPPLTVMHRDELQALKVLEQIECRLARLRYASQKHPQPRAAHLVCHHFEGRKRCSMLSDCYEKIASTPEKLLQQRAAHPLPALETATASASLLHPVRPPASGLPAARGLRAVAVTVASLLPHENISTPASEPSVSVQQVLAFPSHLPCHSICIIVTF